MKNTLNIDNISGVRFSSVNGNICTSNEPSKLFKLIKDTLGGDCIKFSIKQDDYISISNDNGNLLNSLKNKLRPDTQIENESKTSLLLRYDSTNILKKLREAVGKDAHISLENGRISISTENNTTETLNNALLIESLNSLLGMHAEFSIEDEYISIHPDPTRTSFILKNNSGADALIWLIKFPNLKTIKIEKCSNLPNLNRLEHCSMLETIQIDNCNELEDLNILNNLPKLKTLFIQHCPKLSGRSLSIIEELKQKKVAVLFQQ